MSTAPPTVFVLDDEPSVCAALRRLIRSVGLNVNTFTSAPDFLQAERPDAPSCIVLDVRLPGLSGLDLQETLAKSDIDIPVIFITGYGDIPMSVRAMKAGAVEFLTKPLKDQDLLDAIQNALQKDRIRRAHRAEVSRLQSLHGLLTPREKEVLPLIVSGMLNKQIASELATSEKTVKVHRARVLHKMQAKSVADLVRMAEKLAIPSAKS